MTDLKPCPFCGYALTADEGICHKFGDDEEDPDVFTGICCPGCACFLTKPSEHATVEEGIEAWNRRALTAPQLHQHGGGVEPITLAVLRDYFRAIDAGDVPDPATALYSYLLMDGYIPKASAALAQQPLSVHAWQPIETAPIDGSDILVCVTYNLSDDEWETKIWVDWQVPEERWPGYWARIDIPFSPTHWQPLPAAPKNVGGEEE